MLTSNIRTPASSAATIQEPAQHKPRMPSFGVAIFDNPKDLTCGWACLSGQTEFYFRQPTDLPSDCIWVTSAESTDFRQVEKIHHLRPADFFKSKLKNIAADLGMATEGDDWARPAVRALSEIANRTALIAAQVYGWTDPIQHFTSLSLVEDIRKSFVKSPAALQNMRGPLASAYQSYSAPERGNTFTPNSTMLTLRLNRLAYAKRILATPIPDGAWAYVGQEENSAFTYPLERALNPDLPCLVEASVETSQNDPEISVLAAFGAQPGKNRNMRSWITQPELRWLSRHAKIKISRAYYTTGSKPLVERLQLPQMLTSDDVFELSISAGLVAECHWQALTEPVYNAQSTNHNKKDVSVRGAWLRATDRAMCFELALKAHQAGFLVKSYGNGSIVVSLPRTQLHALLDFSMENGIAHPAFREVFERNGLA